MTCTFFGHKNTPDKIKPTLRSTLIDLIENNDVDAFYVGNNGSFDLMVHSLLSELSSIYPIKYSVVLVYIPQKESEDSENTLLPDGIETVPLKYAISYRNKWMVEQSDYVVTYVTHSWGGAAKFKELAKKKGKTVIDIMISIMIKDYARFYP